MQALDEIKVNWLYSFKKKLILIILAILTVSILFTMYFISRQLGEHLVADSLLKTQELSRVVHLSLKHKMLARDPTAIQDTLVDIGSGNYALSRAFIMDMTSRVVYSSDAALLGRKYDMLGEAECNVCHTGGAARPKATAALTTVKGEDVQRSITAIYNEKPCHQCHSPEERLNGILVIDRSMGPINSFISTIQIIIFGGGIICLLILVPVLSKTISSGLDKYIVEINRHSAELKILYLMVERLSKTLDIRELKQVVLDILTSTLGVEEVYLISPREDGTYSSIHTRAGQERASRTTVAEDEELSAIVKEWLDGGLEAEKISPDGSELVIPVRKGNQDLALIVARTLTGGFSKLGLSLVKAMSNHIAIAMDNARLYQIAITDELTSLYSQRFFRTSIDRAFDNFDNYAEKLSLLMIDIDNFKAVNDTYGHVVGDTVLKDFSGRIRECLRDNDLAFRYGGEEFTVILPSTGRNGAMQVAERIREHIEETVFEDGDIKINITCSIGAAVCPEHALSVRDLIVKSDQALYSAKGAGKNRVVLST